MKRIVALGLGLTVLPLSAFALTPEEIRACQADGSGHGCAQIAELVAACQADPTGEGCGVALLAHDLATNWGGEAEPAPEAETGAEAASAGDTANPAPAAADPAEAAAQAAADAAETDHCPVVASTGWRAALEMTGGKGAHLVVRGTVTLPTPGWRLELAPGMADRSARPVQHFQLLASPSAEMVAQVLTDYQVYAETPSLGAYGGVVIQCEGRVLAEIATIR